MNYSPAGRAAQMAEAAWLLIDPAASRIEEANDAGRALLGLSDSTEFPVALDSAMPAIVRLRQFLNGQAPGDRECLTFWSAGKLTNFFCTITSVDSVKSPKLMRVTQAVVHTAADSVSPREAAANNAPSPRSRDDKETLKEIARRIREGRFSQSWPREKPEQGSTPAATTTSHDQRAEGIGLEAKPVAHVKTQDLAKVAHELKTPLSAILAAAEIMRDERLGAMGNRRYLGYASDIHHSATHALAVINAMLRDASDIARHADGPAELNEIAATTVSVMLPMAHARGITLEHETNEGRLEILADGTAARQILMNLLTNALKFTSAGGDVRVVTGYLDDGAVFLVVRDTGEGMNEETMVKAFYEESRDTISLRRGGGYGLGLPMVRRLAEENGAAIEIDSAPGKGTVVLVSFARA